MKKLGILIGLSLLTIGLHAQTPQSKTTKSSSTPSKTTTTPSKTTTPASKTATPSNTKGGTPANKQASTPAKTEQKPAQPTTQQKKAEDKPAESSGSHAFAKGDNIFNLGVGFGHFYGIFSGIVGYPSVNLSYENVFYDFAGGKGAIGLGATAGWWSGHYTSSYWLYYGSDYKANYSRYALGARCTVHYDLFNVPKLDTYAGLNVGVYVGTTHVRYADSNYPSGEYNSHSTSVYPMYGFFVGARYYTGKSNKFGFFGEVGYGLSVLRLGIALRCGK